MCVLSLADALPSLPDLEDADLVRPARNGQVVRVGREGEGGDAVGLNVLHLWGRRTGQRLVGSRGACCCPCRAVNHEHVSRDHHVYS